jgi:hypothetical protein
MRLALAVSAAALLAPAAPAAAGTYTVHGCHTPDGKAAPIEGWAAGYNPGASGYIGNNDYCAAGGGLTMSHFIPAGYGSFSWSNGTLSRWTFTAPKDTEIASVALRRSFTGSNDPALGFQISDRTGYRDYCFGGCTRAGDVTYGDVGGTTLQVQQVCGSGGRDCSDSHSVVSAVQRSAIALRDDAAPTLAAAAGSLVAPGRVLAGVADASVAAQDTGGGLATIAVEVDGAVVDTRIVDGNGGRCATPYTALVPCKLSATAGIAFDTNRVADGRHTLRLLVTDAAGNAAAAGPFDITVRNTPTACGPGAAGYVVRAGFRRGRPRRASVPLGARVRISGRVLANGAPVAGAQVRIVRRLERRAARPGLLPAAVVTGRDGRFRRRLRARTAARLRVGIRVGSDAALTCSRTLRLRTRASATLRASRQVVAGAARVIFRGRLRGGHIPATGKLVVLQGYDRGAWRTFATARSDRRGGFHAGYRFRGRPGTYRVRARIPVDAAYPFAAGRSRAVTVRVL